MSKQGWNSELLAHENDALTARPQLYIKHKKKNDWNFRLNHVTTFRPSSWSSSGIQKKYILSRSLSPLGVFKRTDDIIKKLQLNTIMTIYLKTIHLNTLA